MLTIVGGNWVLEQRPETSDEVTTYVWLYVDDTDLSAVENLLDGVDAGSVQVPLVLAVLQKPAEQTAQTSPPSINQQLSVFKRGTTAPTVNTHGHV